MNLRYKSSRHLKLNMHGAFGYGLINWFTVLYKNKFHIELLAIPKVLWITSSVLSMHVFRVYETLRYDRIVKKTVIKEPVFILGYPRSGTTFLHYLLSKDSRFSYCATYQVLMPHIFMTLGGMLQRMLRTFIPKTRLMDNLKMGSELPKEEEFAMSAISDASMINGFYFPKNMSHYFKRYVLFADDEKDEYEWKKKMLFFLKKVHYNDSEKQLLLKSPFNTARVKQILDIFPDAKFIHIHRNPYEVYYSNEKLYEELLTAFAFHKVENAEVEKHIFDSYREVYKKYLDSISLIPAGNLTTISYEELVKNPIDVLRKTYKELNLANFEEARPHIEFELSTYKDYKTNTHNMSEEVKHKIFNEWSELFEEFGYSSKKILTNPLKAV